VASDKEIEDIIARTITSLHAGNAAIEFKKPKTLKDWTYVVLAIGGVLGFMFTSVVFLNDIADHAKDLHHEGSAELFEKIEHNIASHAASEELHRRESVLELKIIKEVSPIKGELRSIREQVRNVESDIKQVQQSINKISDSLNK
jgi:hypothetical protein